MQDNKGNDSTMPENELERYGVWVKAKPEDIIDEAQNTNASPSIDTPDVDFDASFGLPDIDESLSNNAFLATDNLQTPAQESSDNVDFSTTDVSLEDFGLSNEDDSKTQIQDDLDMNIDNEDKASEFETIDIDLNFDDAPIDDEQKDEPSFDEVIPDSSNDNDSDFESIDISAFDSDSDNKEISFDEEPSVPEQKAEEALDIKVDSPKVETEQISLDSFIDNDKDTLDAGIPEYETQNVTIDESYEDEKEEVFGSDAAELLHQIATELSSIKDELVSLRTQLADVKKENAARDHIEQEKIEVEPKKEEVSSGGFFDDEDDDTIALTGDELDNILNTADFTEESAEFDDQSDDLNQLNIDFSSPSVEEETVTPDIISEDPSLDFQEAVKEPISSGIEDINIPSQDEVVPMTNVPDDESDLLLNNKEEPIEDDIEIDMSSFDNVPLVEPNEDDLNVIVESAFNEDESSDIPTIDEESSNSCETQTEDNDLILDIDGKESDDSLDLQFDTSIEEDETQDIGGIDMINEEANSSEENLFDEVNISLDADEQVEEDTFPDIEDSGSFDDSSFELDNTEQEPDTSFDIPNQFTEPEVKIEEEPQFEPTIEPVVQEKQVEPEPAAKEEPQFEPAIEPVVQEKQVEQEPATKEEPKAEPVAKEEKAETPSTSGSETKLKQDVKTVLLYLDQLLSSLPDEKIEEFASSEHYETYKRIFDDLGLL